MNILINMVARVRYEKKPNASVKAVKSMLEPSAGS